MAAAVFPTPEAFVLSQHPDAHPEEVLGSQGNVRHVIRPAGAGRALGLPCDQVVTAWMSAAILLGWHKGA